MIPMSIYVLLLVVAIAWTTGVIWMATQQQMGDRESMRRVGIVLSAFGLVLWGLIAMFSFEVVSYSGGETFTHEFTELAYFALVGGALMLFSLLQATIEEINATGGI